MSQGPRSHEPRLAWKKTQTHGTGTDHGTPMALGSRARCHALYVLRCSQRGATPWRAAAAAAAVLVAAATRVGVVSIVGSRWSPWLRWKSLQKRAKKQFVALAATTTGAQPAQKTSKTCLLRGTPQWKVRGCSSPPTTIKQATKQQTGECPERKVTASRQR